MTSATVMYTLKAKQAEGRRISEMRDMLNRSSKSEDTVIETPTKEQLKEKSWRKSHSRLDARVFRGLRDEMLRVESETESITLQELGQGIVCVAIVANSLQMGLAIQDSANQFQLLWTISENLFTAIFAAEMIAKIHHQHGEYFCAAWNVLDFVLVWLAILNNWFLPVIGISMEVGVFMVLRMLRVLRIIRLLRVADGMKAVVDGMFKSMGSLGWIMLLLLIIDYIASIILCQVLDKHLYNGVDDFDFDLYFSGVGNTMLTMLNICILDEWGSIIRPVWLKQPHLVPLIFLPYLMMATIGILNLIIGVIAEHSIKNTEENKEAEDLYAKREKMKAILRMADDMFECVGSETMNKEEFEDVALTHPDFVRIMRHCNFPRGFEIASLHLLFDEDNEGRVNKHEFVNGIFRLVFNDLSQHACTILLYISEMRHEIKVHMEEQLRSTLASIHDKVAEVASQDGGARSSPPEVQKTVDHRQVSSSPEWPSLNVDVEPDADSKMASPGDSNRHLHKELQELQALLQATADSALEHLSELSRLFASDLLEGGLRRRGAPTESGAQTKASLQDGRAEAKLPNTPAERDLEARRLLVAMPPAELRQRL